MDLIAYGLALGAGFWALPILCGFVRGFFDPIVETDGVIEN